MVIDIYTYGVSDLYINVMDSAFFWFFCIDDNTCIWPSVLVIFIIFFAKRVNLN